MLGPIRIETLALSERDRDPLQADELRHRIDLRLDHRCAGRADIAHEIGVVEAQHPDERPETSDADRAVAVLERGVGLRPGLSGLAQLERRLGGEPDRPSVAEDDEMLEVRWFNRERA